MIKTIILKLMSLVDMELMRQKFEYIKINKKNKMKRKIFKTKRRMSIICYIPRNLNY